MTLSGPGLLVERAGPLTTVQDLGRPGLAHLGVPRSGAADRGSLRLANRLLGNPEGAAALEVTVGGLVVRARGHVSVAVTGALLPMWVDDVPVAGNCVLHLPRGTRLTMGIATAGVRAYLAIRGGLQVPGVLGSRATDTLAGLGPPVVTQGAVLPVGADHRAWPSIDQAPIADPPGTDAQVVLRAVPGPRQDWLDEPALATLWTAAWTVAADSDRVAARLAGPALARAPGREDAELASEGLVRGAVQVPTSGHPLIFLADHPVTGGYPVAAVLLDAEVDRAAQLRPGSRVRFRRVALPWSTRRSPVWSSVGSNTPCPPSPSL